MLQYDNVYGVEFKVNYLLGKMELEMFKNCSGFTDEELAAVALIRGITSVVCCSVLSVVFVALMILAKFYYQRICGTMVKRLTLGLLAANMLNILSFALQLKYFYDPQDVKFCEANAFIAQFSGKYEYGLKHVHRSFRLYLDI